MGVLATVRIDQRQWPPGDGRVILWTRTSYLLFGGRGYPLARPLITTPHLGPPEVSGGGAKKEKMPPGTPSSRPESRRASPSVSCGMTVSIESTASMRGERACWMRENME